MFTVIGTEVEVPDPPKFREGVRIMWCNFIVGLDTELAPIISGERVQMFLYKMSFFSFKDFFGALKAPQINSATSITVNCLYTGFFIHILGHPTHTWSLG